MSLICFRGASGDAYSSSEGCLFWHFSISVKTEFFETEQALNVCTFALLSQCGHVLHESRLPFLFGMVGVLPFFSLLQRRPAETLLLRLQEIAEASDRNHFLYQPSPSPGCPIISCRH